MKGKSKGKAPAPTSKQSTKTDKQIKGSTGKNGKTAC